MRCSLDCVVKKSIKKLCNDHGFISRGQVFFRIYADNIIQAIGFRYEPTFSHYSLNIGLMSLYSDAEDTLFSTKSTLPKYSICCLENNSSAVRIEQTGEVLSFSVMSPDNQLHILEEIGFSWLDGVATQNDLLCAFDHLESASYRGIIWNNEMKLAPFLAVGDYNSADRVIASILDQQLGPHSFFSHPWSEEDFLNYTMLFPNKNADLLHLHKLISERSEDLINSYLKGNYQKNIDRLHFLRR